MKDCIKFIATIVTGLKKTTFLHLCTFRQVCTLHMKADEFKAQIRARFTNSAQTHCIQ